jgi:hypothetical protein
MTLAFAAGCTPHIGDKCVLSTDCSVQGTLVCDTAQPGGYCTQLNCGRLSCPANSTCVEFQSSVPGCAYDDYQSPSRTGRSFCMENCNADSDCRLGYTCSDPRGTPWNSAILDDNQAQRVCIAAPLTDVADAGTDASSFGAAICQPYDPDAESPFDDGGADAGGDASGDASDRGDGGVVVDAGGDATVDAGPGREGGADAGSDAPGDADTADATVGG